ncbi:MAG: hypothetical protein A2Y62_21780 [Candidatus Fischerbacteria bacterium RBG_13_37_8]|uniref:Uncharacterized protein n=1 Tax=Candidatus Fischerbacteria bacterium RBG_13_37_8 TaxID=1817863 RepID=A0A1F5VTK4_9BACT|nr:MAG: hypothetical protein A2Y62_21780 [Candidatus Fischerbacteria bacterium RBG_13_37_8]
MNFKIIDFIILLLEALCTSAFSDINLFKVSAIPVNDKFVLGEPLMINCSVIYLGDHPVYISSYISDGIEIEGKCDGSRYWHTDKDELIDWKRKKEIKPG